MNINNINFTAFIRVAEAGSFNKAAESLYITFRSLRRLYSDLLRQRREYWMRCNDRL